MHPSLVSLGSHRNKTLRSITIISILVLIILSFLLAGCSKKTATPTAIPTLPTPTAHPTSTTSAACVGGDRPTPGGSDRA